MSQTAPPTNPPATVEKDYGNTGKIILDLMGKGERPTKKLIHLIPKLLEDPIIHGFGVYYGGFLTLEKVWYIMVQSPSMQTPWGQPIFSITLSQLISNYKQSGKPPIPGL